MRMLKLLMAGLAFSVMAANLQAAEEGVDVTQQLADAIISRDMETARTLASNPGVEVNRIFIDGVDSVLHLAVPNSTPEIIGLLLDNGGDGNIKSGTGSTAFERAVENTIEKAREFLNRGYEPTERMLRNANATMREAIEGWSFPEKSAAKTE